MKVNGEVVATGQVPISAPLLFTANDCLDIGIALGSPVSLDYYDKAPFKFNGTIEQVHVQYRIAGQAQAEKTATKEEVSACRALNAHMRMRKIFCCSRNLRCSSHHMLASTGLCAGVRTTAVLLR